MTMDRLLNIIEHALTTEVPESIERYCTPFFSPYYMLLHFLAMNVTEGICVELGVETGRGSFSMLKAGAEVIGVENNADRAGVLMGEPNWTLIIGSSLPVPASIAARGKVIGLLHIDTEHSFAQAREEFNAYKSRLKDGAVVCFDDTNAMDGDVLRFVESLPYERIVDDRLHPGCGYAVIIYRKDDNA